METITSALVYSKSVANGSLIRLVFIHPLLLIWIYFFAAMRDWLPEVSVLVDTSLLVLIWLVQIVIYPSFRYMGGSAFKQWHVRYTRLITFFVAPLMLLQLANTSLWLFYDINAINIIRVVLVGYIWINTFFVAVPIHAKLDVANETQIHKDNLIQTNWPRAAAWTLIFFLSLYQYIILNP